ncbi:restriction endonuclease subunit S [Aureivirga sp. CE67]|uniref:restriction endonuclease subunit S n=1 Tax=Aureivirga sp. CE67 TaxID=1788983 RepID=UPI0018CA2078|nr:restriction endonuclease subunit S [Aureivirga sp. CE67]
MREEVKYPKDWSLKKIGDVLKIGSGKDYKHLQNGNIPVYGTGGFMTFVNDYLYDGESVGIGRKGTIDKPVFLTGKFWTVDTLFYTHSFENISPYYVYLLNIITIDFVRDF